MERRHDHMVIYPNRTNGQIVTTNQGWQYHYLPDYDRYELTRDPSESTDCVWCHLETNDCSICEICDRCDSHPSCDCCHECNLESCMCCENCGGIREDTCECCSYCGEPYNHECDECGGYECRDGRRGCRCNQAIMGYGDVPNSVDFRAMRGDKAESVTLNCNDYYPTAPDTAPYLGLEVECEAYSGSADEIATTWNESGLGWSTHDGSLSDGAECKTHPTTYQYLRQSNFSDTLRAMVRQGARAWGHSSCGLHIHVSTSAFSGKAHQWRFAFLHASALNMELEKIAGRKGKTGYCRFPHEGGDQAPLMDRRTGDYVRTGATRSSRGDYVYAPEYPQKIIAGTQAKQGREVAVNVNEQTIELRFWKGSLNPETVLGAAAIEDALIKWSKNMPFSVIKKMPTWIEFMLWSHENLDETQYNHIAKLAQARGITTTTSINESEEV